MGENGFFSVAVAGAGNGADQGNVERQASEDEQGAEENRDDGDDAYRVEGQPGANPEAEEGDGEHHGKGSKAEEQHGESAFEPDTGQNRAGQSER